MAGTPEVNLADERLEWQAGARREAVSPYRAIVQTIYDPVITADPICLGLFMWPADLTEIHCYLDGSSSPSVTFTLRFGSSITGTGTEVKVGGYTLTSTSHVQVTELDNQQIAQWDLLWMEVTAKSGTVHSFTVIVKHRTRP